MLALLLDLGLEPDERIRVEGMDEILYATGNPLLSCVVLGKRQMAEMLLARGADPNANVYTCGSPLFRAYSQKDWDFVRLLEQHGGLLDAVSAGFASQTEAARQLLADEAAGRLRPGAVLPGSTVSEDLLWTACGGGDPEIVRLALEGIDWPRQDSRWLGSLWQAFTCDRVERGLACFRLVLDRADPTTAIPAKRSCTLSWRVARLNMCPLRKCCWTKVRESISATNCSRARHWVGPAVGGASIL
jgi:hypothetical protein